MKTSILCQHLIVLCIFEKKIEQKLVVGRVRDFLLLFGRCIPPAPRTRQCTDWTDYKIYCFLHTTWYFAIVISSWTEIFTFLDSLTQCIHFQVSTQSGILFSAYSFIIVSYNTLLHFWAFGTISELVIAVLTNVKGNQQRNIIFQILSYLI